MSLSSKARTRIALSLWQAVRGAVLWRPHVPVRWDGWVIAARPTPNMRPTHRTHRPDGYDRGKVGHRRAGTARVTGSRAISRPGSSSPLGAAASAAGSGLAPTRTTPKGQAQGSGPGAPATRHVYRLLLMKGMTPTEAASLTALICGLSSCDLRWSLKQLNQLLFLRRMRQSGRFGWEDGAPNRPH